MAEHAGEFDTARMMWSATYQNTQDQLIRQNAVEHLRALHVDEDVTHLQEAVTRFGERTGRLPASISELAKCRAIAGNPGRSRWTSLQAVTRRPRRSARAG